MSRTQLCVFVFSIAAGVTTAQAQVAVGPNVNMSGGAASFTPPSTIVGDPFLQRQNEPSIAVSSRNPCHLLAGANDYRLVDVEDAAGEVGDAWLGVFKSFDCGATWTSTLLPGHKLDSSAEGLASPIKGLAAAADPTVRAGTNGLFYYSGISFNRGDNQPSKVFVSRFVDNNNKDGGDPIQYLGTQQIDLGTSGQFLDKPWVVADVPRDGAMCTINGRSVPAGPAYLVYTSFIGGAATNVHSKIMFSKSLDCGVTWSNPAKLSERVAQNQGTTIAIDPGTGAIYIAWREFAIAGDSSSRNSILVVKSTDGGKTFTKAAPIAPNNYTFQPFDQASSPLTFRTNAYPTIAVVPAESEGRAAGQPGRVYVAWAARGFGGVRPSDSRIVMSSSLDGAAWSYPKITDSYQGAGHQIMPAMAFAGGKLALAYYDLRDDASGGFDDLVFEYGQQPYLDCMLSPGPDGPMGFTAVMQCIVTASNRLSRRHTLDMRASMADAACLRAGTCDLTTTSVIGGSRKVSRYIEGRGDTGGGRVQLQWNRPNLPLFSKGKFPFIGDYIDIAGQSFVATDNNQWSWNTGLTVNRPSPVFHVSWSDNRNVGTPRNANWEQFTPPVLGPNSVVCVPGQVGIRNQDVYSAELRPGLVVSSPMNSKRIAGLQRSFVVIAQNTSDSEHQYVLRAQPPAGVIASFDQFGGFGTGAAVGQVVVTIPRKSSATRTLFVGLENPPADPSAAPDVVVPVTVDQVPDDTSASAFDMVYLDPDFENPDFENPDFENTEFHNPDFENVDAANPDFENPDFENFTLAANSSIRNPDFENPDFENPDFENPDFENSAFTNPDLENPDYENPDFENPDMENPDFENPDFENPDFENGSFQVSDTTWPVRNNGNTTSAYKTNVFVSGGGNGIRYQLVVRKVFPSPAAVCAVPGSTKTPLVPASVPLINIINPNVQTNPFDRNFNDPSRDNATFSLAPGERGIITLRAYCDETAPNCTRDLVASLQGNIALGVVAQGANCATCTGAACSLVDKVKGGTECSIVDGPPKDIYDPIPPAVAVVNPTLTTPDTVIVTSDNDNNGNEPVAFTINATDNVAVAEVTCVSGTTAITSTGNSGAAYAFAGIFPVGNTGVTCTASDLRATPAPNTASVAFIVRVKDVTPPSFDLPPGSIPGSPFVPSNPAEATGPAGAVVNYTNPTATDTNGGDVQVDCASTGGLSSGSTFPIGNTPINCVATDVSGVSTPPTNLFNISVADHTPPAITVSGDATMTVEAGSVFADPGATANDLVSGPAATSATGSVNTLVPGTYTITYTATDASGNTASATRTVLVVDTTAPVFGAVANVIAEATSGAGATVSYTTPTATDLSGATVSCLPASGSTFALGVTTVTCSAKDPAQNTSLKTFTVTVRDTTAPVIGPAANVTANATTASGAAVTYALPSATDAVSVPTVTCLPASGATFAIGTTTVSCTARDAAGNTATRTFTVTVNDLPPALTVTANPPTLLWSPNKTMTPVTVSGVITSATLASATYKVTDEYGKVQPAGNITVGAGGAYSFVISLEAYRNGNDADGRFYTVLVTVTDAQGRIATATAIVQVPHNQ